MILLTNNENFLGIFSSKEECKNWAKETSRSIWLYEKGEVSDPDTFVMFPSDDEDADGMFCRMTEVPFIR